jgi:hypothetical protein
MDPSVREEMSNRMRVAIADGTRVLPPVKRGKDHPSFGRKFTEEQRARMSAAAKIRGGHPHLETSKDKISAGNVRSIQDRKRSYKYYVQGPSGVIPCRSSSELMLAQHLIDAGGIVAMRGEDILPFVSYEILGRTRVTVADLEIDRVDGRTVVVEAKSKADLYRLRSVLRLKALWQHCQQTDKLFILAFNGAPIPSIQDGPFVTEEFMNRLSAGSVRRRLMRKDQFDATNI